MKKILNRVSKGVVVACAMLTAVGCEDFLDKQPLDGFSDVSVYADESLTFAYLSECYNYMFHGFADSYGNGYSTGGNGWAHTLNELSDDSRSKSSWIVANKVYGAGLLYASSGFCENWQENYKAIFKCNTLMAGLEQYSELAEATEARFVAEARFIRASQYFHLVIRYGDIPLIKEAQDIDGDLLTPQSTAAEVYDFIATEFAEAAEDLPSAADLATTEYGRATKEACWAYQGRALLFAERWAESAAASKKVIDSNYFELEAEYEDICHIHYGTISKECVFDVLFDGVVKYNSFDKYCSPTLAGSGSSFYNATQSLVDAYETLNGMPVVSELATKLSTTVDPTYDDVHAPYANRDKRLEATIVYHGQEYRGQITDFSCTKGADGIIAGNNTDAFNAGSGASVTGYWTKKFTSTDSGADPYSDITWTELRYAEVLLNYAEALTKASDSAPSQEVYDYLNMTRTRGGLPKLEVTRPNRTKAQMIEELKNERRVELAFQSNRIFDLIRYGDAYETLNNLTHMGMAPIKAADGSITYERVESIYTQIFHSHYTRFPIPFSEIEANPNLVQNPGY